MDSAFDSARNPYEGARNMKAPAKTGTLAALLEIRTRFVNCAIHNGSDRSFAEAACEDFDSAIRAVAELIEAAKFVRDNAASDSPEMWEMLNVAIAHVQGSSE